MTTVIPTKTKRPMSGPPKSQTSTATPITNMVTSKPVRHLAILPSSKDPPSKSRLKEPSNLSGNSIDHRNQSIQIISLETFTLYEGPTTTPTLARSLDDTITLT